MFKSSQFISPAGVILALALMFLASVPAQAADDPSIKGQIRTDIQASMAQFIKDRKLEDGSVIHYDPATAMPDWIEAGHLRSAMEALRSEERAGAGVEVGPKTVRLWTEGNVYIGLATEEEMARP